MSSPIQIIYSLLLEEYGPQGWWPVRGRYFPPEEDPFEIIAGALLTQNTSWKNALKAIEDLRARGLLSPKKIIEMDDAELAPIIKSSGYYNQKAKRLKSVCAFYLHSSRSKEVPTREELLKLKGIGPETADSILLYAYHIPIFVVDAYTRRMFDRINLLEGDISYVEIQDLFMNNLPYDERLFNEYHALIVRHGKEICRKVPLCDRCVIGRENLCKFSMHRK